MERVVLTARSHLMASFVVKDTFVHPLPGVRGDLVKRTGSLDIEQRK